MSSDDETRDDEKPEEEENMDEEDQMEEEDEKPDMALDMSASVDTSQSGNVLADKALISGPPIPAVTQPAPAVIPPEPHKVPLTVRVLREYAKDISKSPTEVALALEGVNKLQVGKIVKDAAKMYLNIVTSGDSLQELVDHYDGDLSVAEIEVLTNLFEAQKPTLIKEEIAKKKYMAGEARTPFTDEELPQNIPRGRGKNKPQEPQVTMSNVNNVEAADVSTPHKALLFAMESIMGLTEKQKFSIMQMFQLSPSLQDNPTSLLDFLKQALGQLQGQRVWSLYMTGMGQLQQQQNNASTPFTSTLGFGLNAGIPQQGTGNPQMDAVLLELKMKQLQQQQEDEREERQQKAMSKQMQQMVNTVMMSVMARAMNLDNSGGGHNQFPFGMGLGGIGGNTSSIVEYEKDEKGVLQPKRIVMAPAPKTEDGAMSAVLNAMAQQNKVLLEKMLTGGGNNEAKEYTNFALTLVDKLQAKAAPVDGVDSIIKLRQAFPDVFQPRQSSLDEIKLGIDSQMAMFDKKVILEDRRAERDDKMLDKVHAHENMKEYITAIKETGADLLKKPLEALAQGMMNNPNNPLAAMAGQQQQQQPQQPQQQRPQHQQQPQQPVNFAAMDSQTLKSMAVERDRVMAEWATNYKGLQERSNALDLELHKRNALKTGQNSAAQASYYNMSVSDEPGASPPT